MQIGPENAALVGYTCCILHNLLSIRRPQQYLQIVKAQDNGPQPDRTWENAATMHGLQVQGGNNARQAGVHVRDHLRDYYNSAAGAVEWQRRAVLHHVSNRIPKKLHCFNFYVYYVI